MKLVGYNIKNETCSIIGQFAIVWAQFECEFFANCYNYKSLSRVSVAKANETLISAVKEMREVLQHYAKENYSEGFRWEDKLCIRNNERQYEYNTKKFLSGDTLTFEDEIISCIFICGRIRNNLLHGLKDIVFLDKQVNIFKALKNFLEILIIQQVISKLN